MPLIFLLFNLETFQCKYNMEPRLVIDDFTTGFHNKSEVTFDRLESSNLYRDLSTICIIPSGKTIPARVVQSWLQMQAPMNQKFIRIFAMGLEVGVAYTKTIEQILAHPALSQFKFILTLEHDNVVSPDSLINIYKGMDEYDVIGGVYFTKGEGGQPMCYGKPDDKDSFIPFMPSSEGLTACNGVGMGFTLFKMDLFKDEKIEKPWFETKQDKTGQGTQDLIFCKKAVAAGYKFAVDGRVKIGHYDVDNDIIW